jgi:muramidase (phage lysozyme)
MAVISAKQAGDVAIVVMLDTLAWAEGTSTDSISQNDGYDVIVTSVDGPSIFTDYSTHPMLGKTPLVIRRVPLLRSDAAGRYQLMARYYPIYTKQLGLHDFSPLSQDIIAIQQMRERRTLSYLTSGDVEKAMAAHLTPLNLAGPIEALSGTWASLPGNNYGQGGRSMATMLSKYQELYNSITG